MMVTPWSSADAAVEEDPCHRDPGQQRELRDPHLPVGEGHGGQRDEAHRDQRREPQGQPDRHRGERAQHSQEGDHPRVARPSRTLAAAHDGG
jgi:hypothetical protein